MLVRYNATFPRANKSFQEPSLADIGNLNIKNCDFNKVLEMDMTPYVRHVLGLVKLKGNHKYCTVDIKTDNFRCGNYTCIPGWHCDTTIIPSHNNNPEVHHIFASGSALTEFINEPIDLDVPDDLKLDELFRLQVQIPEDVKIKTIKSCTWHEYGRLHFHRGPKVKHSERRLFIRVTESDIKLKPQKLKRFDTKYEYTI